MTDIIDCADEKLTPFVRQKIQNIIAKEGFTACKMYVKNISTNGGNYLGTLQAVALKGQIGSNDKTLHLFIKNVIQMDESIALKSAEELYLREGFFYNELLEMFNRVQDKYNIPQEDRLQAVKAYCEKNDKVIILDDVTKKGYKTYDRFVSVNLKFAELSIIQLGKLHALSFIVREQYPKFFDENIRSLRTMFKFVDQFHEVQRKIYDVALESLEDEARIKLGNFYSKSVAKWRQYLDVSAEDGFCLIHADFKLSNMLVKEIDGVPSKVIPIDYQLINYGYPVIDFIFFIFVGTDQEFRRDHLDNLKELYYSTFKTFLSKFYIDADVVYSRKQFELHYKSMLDYGLMCFIMLMPFHYARADAVPVFENGMDCISMNMDDRYKDRLRGIVDDFIQWGYL